MKFEEYDLQARYDSRKSFYGKAVVREYADGSKELYSYHTLVARINADGSKNASAEYWASQTTNRHIREFYRQNGIEWRK